MGEGTAMNTPASNSRSGYGGSDREEFGTVGPDSHLGDTLSDVPAVGSEESSDDVASARAQIEETRAHMTETIDAIKDKLSPAHLVEEAKEAALGKAKDAVSGVVDAVKDKAAAVADAVSGAYHAASDKASDVAHGVAERFSAGREDEYRSPTILPLPTASANKGNLGATIVDTIKMNPLPAAIAGFGLGWLLLSMQRQQNSGSISRDTFENPADAYSSNFGTAANNDGPGLRDRASDLAHSVGDKASDLAQSVSGKASDIAQNVSGKASDIAQTVSGRASDIKDRASDWAGGVRDSAGQLKDRAGDTVNNLTVQTKQQAGAAVDSTTQFIHEQPLAAAAIALLIGAAVGLALPATQTENAYLGPQRDKLVDQGKDAAHDVASKVQNVANVALGQAKTSLSSTVDQAKQQIQQTVQQTRDTVVNEAQHQGLATSAA
jgi:ElaB/YqjD/DUF883 family membrane-anchored ribosome-binding protein